MKIKHIAMVMTSALLTVGLIPAASAQESFGSAQQGIEVITGVGKRPTQEAIEVITIVGKRPTQEGIEVITVVAKRPAPTVASTCVNAVIADKATGNAQSLESREANRISVRRAIKDCITQAQTVTASS